MKRALITGLTGFVGSHLADYILEYHSEVDIVSLNRWRSSLDNVRHIQDKVTFEWGDLEDLSSLKRLLKMYKPDAIFHLAAQSYVDYSYIAPTATLMSNVVGTCNLLEAIKMLKAEEGYNPIIHVCSSSEVYGQVREKDVPITEDCPFRPASPYAVSKVGVDMLAYQYFISWGLHTIRTRMFTHTGPRRGDVFVVSTFAKQIVEIEVGLNKENTIQVGNLASVRTFMDVRDAVRAYWLLVNGCPAGEVYNIGGNETMEIGEMLDMLLDLSVCTKESFTIKQDPERMRPSDVTLQIPSTEKFHKATGWEPEIRFERTLEDTLDYWRKYYGVKR